MSIGLHNVSTLEWHNLLENPKDLPVLNMPLPYLCMIAFPEEIENPHEVTGFGITECLYIPELDEWFSFIDETVDPQNPNYEEPINEEAYKKEILNRKFMYKKPAGTVIMWCDPGSSYMKYSQNKKELI